MTRSARRSRRIRAHRRGTSSSNLLASHWTTGRRRFGHPERRGWRDPAPAHFGPPGELKRPSLPPRRWGRARSRAM